MNPDLETMDLMADQAYTCWMAKARSELASRLTFPLGVGDKVLGEPRLQRTSLKTVWADRVPPWTSLVPSARTLRHYVQEAERVVHGKDQQRVKDITEDLNQMLGLTGPVVGVPS